MATLQITILADASKAKKELAATGNAADDMGKTLGGVGTAVAAGAAAGAAALVSLGVNAFQAAAESAKIGRETERVIRTTGAAAWTSADQVSELAGAISDKSGADDEAIQSGANLLLTFTNLRNEAGAGNDVFDQATQAALDMSTALGTDMSSASIQLGKALNDPIKGLTALAKSGVSFTEQQKDQIRAMVEAGDVLGAQKIILGEVQKEFGGAAEAAGTPLDKLMVKMGNVQEAAGAYLIPAVDAVATAIGDNMGPALEAGTAFLADHTEALKYLASVGLVALAGAYGPVIAAQAAMVGGKVIGFFGELAGSVIYAGQAFVTVAGQQGILVASTQALNYALAAAGPALLALAAGGAIYALISSFDKTSEAADKLWDSLNRDIDPSNLQQIAGVTGQVSDRMEELTRAQAAAGFGDLAASAADLLIPFHDVENSLRDQQKEHDALSAKEQERQAKLTATNDALRQYADTQAGVNNQNQMSVGFWEASTTAMSDAELAASDITGQLQAIAESKKIDLTEPGAADKVQALYEKTTYLSTSTLQMSEAQEKYNDAAATAKDKVDAYRMALDGLIAGHLGARQAETAYSQNSVSLLKTLAENRLAAAGATEAGTNASLAQITAINNNNRAIQDNAKSAIDLANATYQETQARDGSSAALQAASGQLAAHREQLINTMVQTGYSRAAAEAYVNQLGLTPDAINTAIHLDNAQATGELAGTQGQLNTIAQGANATVTANTSPAQRALDDFYRRNPNWSSAATEWDFGWGPRAAGGPVAAGGTYLVGEAGPELFSPTRSGWIIPNRALAASTATTAPGGGTTIVNNWNITVPNTGLGVDSPRLQRDIVAAIRRHEARNGRPILAGAG